ncbi:MAG TPA: DUF5017 domain-containing protein [Anseongella sp.]|nr:DUF5017 domain-containing protein [Anseongella sp.]
MRINYLICAGLLLWSSCSKDLQVSEAPDFDVTVESPAYKVGENVLFRISGGADIISFYSGEVYNDYAYRDGRVVAVPDSGATLSFTSAVQGGSQENQLSVLVSSDFNGNYESLETVKAATWTDITDRFTLGTSATFLASTPQDISDLMEAGKPLYIAFKYLTRPQAENGLARTWMIQALSLTSNALFNDANLPITDQVRAGFRIVDQDSVNTPARSLITSTQVRLLGNIYKDPDDPVYDPNNPIYDPNNPIYDPDSELYDPTAVRPEFVPYDPESPYNDPLRENWAVSSPINIGEVDLGPDWSIPVRGIRNEAVEEYSHIYTKPGTYKVYFVASNNTVDDVREVVKELTVTIEP